MELDETLSVHGTSTAGLGPGVRAGGRYRIVRLIGTGGMGEVFEAEDLVVGGKVALKALRTDRMAANAIERMRREIALARRITHANVCRIHDLGDHEGRVFLTMELLEGETLADRVRAGPLAIAEARAIADQLCAGLSAAHAAGVIHRDFKAANVMLSGTRAVITDFGLARSEAGDHTDLTGDAAMLGTAAYMAPEQVEGKPATPASDIYALGVVLFEMITGKQPFRGDTPLQTASARLLSTAPSAGTLRDDAPAVWTSTIARCLERVPRDRFASVAEVTAALDHGVPLPPRSVAIAGAIGIVAIGAVVALAIHETASSSIESPPPVATPIIAPAAQPSFLPLTFRRGSVRAARFHPDGKQVLYSAAWTASPRRHTSPRPANPRFASCSRAPDCSR